MDKILNCIKSQKLLEMAYQRSDALSLCNSYGYEFIEHFMKIFNSPNSESVSHWISEMQNNWLNKVRNIVLKSSNKRLSYRQLYDWFFTVGSTLDVLFEGKSSEMKDSYSKFINDLKDSYNVHDSLVNIGLISDNDKLTPIKGSTKYIHTDYFNH